MPNIPRVLNMLLDSKFGINLIHKKVIVIIAKSGLHFLLDLVALCEDQTLITLPSGCH